MSKGNRQNLERLLRSASERQHFPVASIPRNKRQPDSSRRLVDFVVARLTAIFGFFAFGAALLPTNFVVGLVLILVSVVLLPVDFKYSGYLRGWKWGHKLALALAYLTLLVAMAKFWLFKPAPFAVFSSSQLGNYGQGSVIGGIPWQPRYSQFNITIANPTADDFTNFDATVSTDIVIKALRYEHGVSGCNVSGTHSPADLRVQPMENGVPTGPSQAGDSNYAAVPLDKDGNGLLPESGGADWSYRITCDKIASYSQDDFEGVLEVVNPTTPGHTPQHLFGDPKPATWASITARYQAGGRSHMGVVSECPMKSVCRSR